jgi:hypothetical protein
MASLEQDIQGPGVERTGPITKEHFIVMFTKKALSLMVSAAFVLAGIPEFGLQMDALIAPGASKGPMAQDKKEAP